MIGSREELIADIMADIDRSQNRVLPDVFEVCKRRFVILKGVFSPIVYDSTEFFAERLPYSNGGRFFEVGTGSGAISVTAALEGCGSCKGIDINEEAVANSILNAKLYGVEKRCEFSAMDINDLNDFGDCNIVFWAHPWVHGPTCGRFGILERSIFDPGYEGVKRFIHLANPSAGRRVFLGFGNTGNHILLNEICEAEGLKIEVRDVGISRIDPRYTYQLLELR